MFKRFKGLKVFKREPNVRGSKATKNLNLNLNLNSRFKGFQTRTKRSRKQSDQELELEYSFDKENYVNSRRTEDKREKHTTVCERVKMRMQRRSCLIICSQKMSWL